MSYESFGGELKAKVATGRTHKTKQITNESFESKNFSLWMLKRLWTMKHQVESHDNGASSLSSNRFPLDRLEAHSIHNSDLVNSVLHLRHPSVGNRKGVCIGNGIDANVRYSHFYCNSASWEEHSAFAARTRYFLVSNNKSSYIFRKFTFAGFYFSLALAACTRTGHTHTTNSEYTDCKQWQRFIPFISCFRRLLNINSLLPLLQFMEGFFFASHSWVAEGRPRSVNGSRKKKEEKIETRLFNDYLAFDRGDSGTAAPATACDLYMSLSRFCSIRTRWIRRGGGIKSVQIAYETRMIAA